MSAAYSSCSVDLGSASSANALRLSLCGGRKRYSFDSRQRIKTRRKQLNPVRFPIETIQDRPHIAAIRKHYPTNVRQYIANVRRCVPVSVLPTDSKPCFGFQNDTVTETGSTIHANRTTPAEQDCDSAVPLNLTKDREIKTHPTAPRSPHTGGQKSNVESAPAPAATTANHRFVDKNDHSPPFSHRPATVTMRNLLANARATCRIFNPQAFCNICNKEFCNKYFLKTHKANKHGVYNENKELCMANDVVLAAAPSVFVANANPSPPNHYLFTNATKDTSAFCNVCEKEFCNKYFARRHKEKMHGILAPFDESRRTDEGAEKCEDDERPSGEGNFSNELNCEREMAPSDCTDAVSQFVNNYVRNKEGKERRSDSALENVSHWVEDKYAAATTGRVLAVLAKREDYDNESPKTAASSGASSCAEYQCDYCKKSFTATSVRKLHQKYVHHVYDVHENVDDADSRRTESIYLMILKFSWLNATVTYCEICEADFENNDLLEMHLMHKHGSLVDEVSRIIEDAADVNGIRAPSVTVGEGAVMCAACQVCGRTFTSNAAFQQHVYEKCSRYPDIGSDTSVVDHVENDSNGSSNFCRICKKELCNKYFMKTHMRRMHGIDIRNGVRIGGVTCEICEKVLCSKYFLRVHMKKCHGISEGNTVARPAADNERAERERQRWQSCAICGRLFKSMKRLKTHLFNDHGNLGAGVRQDVLGTLQGEDGSEMKSEPSERIVMLSQPKDEKQILSPTYQCSECRFQASSVDLLLTHQKVHVKPLDLLPYRCMYCFVVTKDKFSLEEHIAYHHHHGSGGFQERNDFATRYHVTSDSPGTLNTKNHFYSISNAS